MLIFFCSCSENGLYFIQKSNNMMLCMIVFADLFVRQYFLEMFTEEEQQNENTKTKFGNVVFYQISHHFTRLL